MMTKAGHDAAFDAELASHLASCERSGGYRVLEVLKASDYERTEKVVFEGGGAAGAAGELGPFVRKRIDASCGLGRAYGQLLAAQARGLRCPNLPRILDCWNDGRWLNVVMEWLPGMTLAEHVAKAGPSPELARDAVAQVAIALGVLHEGLGGDAPIIHRDLKPSNVMVVGGADGVPRTFVLIDLGIARKWREGAEADTTRLGTRSYAPPEQFGFGQTGIRSDVYALGALLYFCLTGEDPAPGRTTAQLAAHPCIPAELEPVIARAMSFDPADRYESVDELARALVGEGGEKPGRASRRPATPRRDTLTLLGRAWNALLAIATLVLVAASLGNFVAPAPASAGYPAWFLALEYLLWLPVSFAAAAYLLADKRRLRVRMPIGRQRVICVAIIVGLLLLVIVTGVVGGVL